MFDSYSFGIAESEALVMADLAIDCPDFVSKVASYVAFEQAEEMAHELP